MEVQGTGTPAATSVSREPDITDPRRLRNFAAFFKNYMGLSSFVVAALPIPVTWAKLIPVNPRDAGSLSVLTSLTCFLILAFIFYSRHSLARKLFVPIGRYEGSGDSPGRTLWRANESGLSRAICGLIAGTIFLFLAYMFMILMFQAPGRVESALPDEFHRVLLMGLYASFFATAEAAFVLMATKEYLQDLLGASDLDLIGDHMSEPEPAGDYSATQGPDE